MSCHLDPSCIWHKNLCETYNTAITRPRPIYKKPQCAQLCVEHTTCENCTSLSNLNGQYQSECVWCGSQTKCVLKKSVHISFPFGECLYLTSDHSKCHTISNIEKVKKNDNFEESKYIFNFTLY